LNPFGSNKSLQELRWRLFRNYLELKSAALIPTPPAGLPNVDYSARLQKVDVQFGLLKRGQEGVPDMVGPNRQIVVIDGVPATVTGIASFVQPNCRDANVETTGLVLATPCVWL
jgi:hypothetical protein